MKNLRTAILMIIVTTVLLGLIYPLVDLGLAQLIFPDKGEWAANQTLRWHVIGTGVSLTIRRAEYTGNGLSVSYCMIILPKR